MSFWPRRRAGGSHSHNATNASSSSAASPKHVAVTDRTYVKVFFLTWIFAMGYLIGYVHHGQHFLEENNILQKLPRPFLSSSETPDTLSNTSQSSPPTLSATLRPAPHLPMPGSFCSINATNTSYLFDKDNPKEAYDYFLSHKPPNTGYDGISAVSLRKELAVSSSEHLHLISCVYFDVFCINYRALVPVREGARKPTLGSRDAEMTEDAISVAYDLQQITPMFYPNLTEIGKRITGNNFARKLGEAMAQNNWERLNAARRGNNLVPPEIALVFDAYVTKQGSVLNPHILIEAWPDTANSKWDEFVNDYLGVKGNTTKWRHVEQIVVLTHTHQNMFWHWMVSEAYRLLLVYRYLLANPDIYIHIWGGAPLIQKYHDMLGLDKSRFISEENVRADVVYYVQSIDRSDIPSVGFTGLIRHHLLDIAGIPLDQRKSNLIPSTGIKQKMPILEGVSEVIIRNCTIEDDTLRNLEEGRFQKVLEEPEVVIKILFIIRDNPHIGRIVVNYQQMLEEFWKLALNYPFLALTRGHHMRIELAEHPPKGPLQATWRSFGTADIVIGPHGAGFANMFAMRPGSHIVEFVAARHLNILATARLGLAYHGILTNMTAEGISSVAKSQNYLVDIPFVLSLVQDILDERFP